MKRRTLIPLLAAALLGVVNADDKSNPDTLRVALLPDENASTIIKANEGFQAYLEEKTGKKVELVVTTDYASMIEAMRRGRIELGYFGPLSYTLAKDKSPEIEAFAAQKKKGSATYHSIIIGNVESGVKKPEDVEGKTMAYGDQASTSSHLIPKSILLNMGLKAGDQYEEQFLGAHDAVALAVQNGNAEMGGMSEPIYHDMVERGILDPEKVKILMTSEPFPNYPWTMQGYLAPELKEALKKAFFELDDMEILKEMKADGFAPITDKDYDKVRALKPVLE